MTRGISILVAIAAGIAAVYLLPALWLGPLAAAAAGCAAILGIIVRLATHTEPHANPLVGVMSSVFSIPERPLAKGQGELGFGIVPRGIGVSYLARPIGHSACRRLTPPSSGRPKGRFAPFGPPLMSNVRPQWRHRNTPRSLPQKLGRSSDRLGSCRKDVLAPGLPIMDGGLRSSSFSVEFMEPWVIPERRCYVAYLPRRSSCI